MVFQAAVSTVGEGNADGPSRCVTGRGDGSATRALRGRRVDRVGFGREAGGQFGAVVDGARDGRREA